nr:MAG TPA: hypothetical protein [Caudoviricetes sp.]
MVKIQGSYKQKFFEKEVNSSSSLILLKFTS